MRKSRGRYIDTYNVWVMGASCFLSIFSKMRTYDFYGKTFLVLFGLFCGQPA